MEKEKKEFVPKAMKVGEERFLLSTVKSWSMEKVRMNDKGHSNQYIAYKVIISRSRKETTAIFERIQSAEEILNKLDNYFGLL